MMSILLCLLGISWSTDGMGMTYGEWWALRGCFSLHMGWIICASVVSWNVNFDASMASQSTLLAVAIVTVAVALAAISLLTFAVKSPDVVASCVVAWAFVGINTSLSNPVLLNSPTRYNPSIWSPVILHAIQQASMSVMVISLLLAASASALRIYSIYTSPDVSKVALIEHKGDGQLTGP